MIYLNPIINITADNLLSGMVSMYLTRSFIILLLSRISPPRTHREDHNSERFLCLNYQKATCGCTQECAEHHGRVWIMKNKHQECKNNVCINYQVHSINQQKLNSYYLFLAWGVLSSNFENASEIWEWKMWTTCLQTKTWNKAQAIYYCWIKSQKFQNSGLISRNSYKSIVKEK